MKLFYSHGNTHNKLMHIRAIVDDNIYVFRYYGRHGWRYVAEEKFFFELRTEKPGQLTLTGWDEDYKPNPRT